MDPIDRLLSNLTSGLTDKPTAKPLPKPASKSVPNAVAFEPSEESIDQLLARLGEPKKQAIRDSLLQPTRSATPQILTVQPSAAPAIVVPEVAAYAIQQTALAQAQQQAADAEIQRQATLKRQRQQELQLKAQQELRSGAQRWLETLDPKSVEGCWFDDFGCNYDSRLEAAIAYLEALQEVDHFLG